MSDIREPIRVVACEEDMYTRLGERAILACASPSLLQRDLVSEWGWTALSSATSVGSSFLVVLWLGASFRTCFDLALLVGCFSSTHSSTKVRYKDFVFQ